MIWPAIIAGVASLAGGAMSYFGGQNANQNTAQMAHQQMEFQQQQLNQQQAYNTAMTQGAQGMNWDMWKGSHQFAADQGDLAWQRNRDAFNTSMAQTWDMARYQTAVQQEAMSTAMNYGERMSATQYQRAMQDMRAAGLNPMLAYQQGGASSPQIGGISGGSGNFSSQAPGAPSGTGGSAPGTPGISPGSGAMATMRDIITPAIQSAIQGSRVLTELEQLQANVNQTKAQTAQTTADTALREALTVTESEKPDQVRTAISESIRRQYNLDASTRNIEAQTRTEAGRPALVGAQASSAAAQAANTRQETEMTRVFGRNSFPANVAGSISNVLQELYRHIR